MARKLWPKNNFFFQIIKKSQVLCQSRFAVFPIIKKAEISVAKKNVGYNNFFSQIIKKSQVKAVNIKGLVFPNHQES